MTRFRVCGVFLVCTRPKTPLASDLILFFGGHGLSRGLAVLVSYLGTPFSSGLRFVFRGDQLCPLSFFFHLFFRLRVSSRSWPWVASRHLDCLRCSFRICCLFRFGLFVPLWRAFQRTGKTFFSCQLTELPQLILHLFGAPIFFSLGNDELLACESGFALFPFSFSLCRTHPVRNRSSGSFFPFFRK